jgi:hypothetical protein
MDRSSSFRRLGGGTNPEGRGEMCSGESKRKPTTGNLISSALHIRAPSQRFVFRTISNYKPARMPIPEHPGRASGGRHSKNRAFLNRLHFAKLSLQNAAISVREYLKSLEKTPVVNTAKTGDEIVNRDKICRNSSHGRFTT